MDFAQPVRINFTDAARPNLDNEKRGSQADEALSSVSKWSTRKFPKPPKHKDGSKTILASGKYDRLLRYFLLDIRGTLMCYFCDIQMTIVSQTNSSRFLGNGYLRKQWIRNYSSENL